MGARRSGQAERQQTGAQAAVAVGLVGAAGATRQAFVAAVAPLLLPLMPAGLLSDFDAAGDVAEGAARLLHGAEPVPVPSGGFARSAAMEAISYRAAYAAAAVGRLSASVLGAEGGERGEALRKALEAERRHLSAHLDATKRRLAGARVIDGLVELHGPVLSWNWGQTRTPDEPRPNHKAADKLNWDTRRGVPAETGATPGVLAGCSCAAGPPVRGARMLAWASPSTSTGTGS